MGNYLVNSATPTVPLGSKEPKMKVIIYGDFGVGKSSLLFQYTGVERCKVSEVDFHNILLKVYPASKRFLHPNLRINIWDTYGQERYATLSSLLVSHSHVVILVYDVTNTASFTAIDNHYTKIVEMLESSFEQKPISAHSIPISSIRQVTFALVANKTDLSGRKVTTSTGRLKSSALNALYYETSSKDLDSVKQMFENVLYAAQVTLAKVFFQSHAQTTSNFTDVALVCSS